MYRLFIHLQKTLIQHCFKLDLCISWVSTGDFYRSSNPHSSSWGKGLHINEQLSWLCGHLLDFVMVSTAHFPESFPEPSPCHTTTRNLSPRKKQMFEYRSNTHRTFVHTLLSFLCHFDSTVKERNFHSVLLDEITIASISFPPRQIFNHYYFLFFPWVVV